ncbi:hypothetical protein AeMF1_006711 [Aphanomyces euteiches]|nr:hypothetical protein AeMF1_006711 [Aphanomyces euteiches]KAH9183775.1 hypothetical protein AeNC1_014248 [Aphanomyces euteiches]
MEGYRATAIQIHQQDICRFVEELDFIVWSQRNIVFLDEVSFDNCGILRRRGNAMKGDHVVIRGEFGRKPRVSLLCFLGADGVIDYFDVERTFDTSSFLQSCCAFAHNGKVKMYPGSNFLWVLDGAKIHCNEATIMHLRSLGVVPVFLPAYCPFYNPIEYFFGYLKKKFQRSYAEFRT